MDAQLTGQGPPAVLPPMRRIVVSLLKGGVAKSETAVHLAHGLALAGHRVLLVDTDVQSHCAEMLGLKPERGLANLIAGWVEPLEALVQARENLWLLAGGNDLAAVKMEIARREMAPEAVLAEALECYEGRFHFMVMDTAPGWDTLLVNALYCNEEVLAPVSMEPMAISGLKRFEKHLEVIRKYKPLLSLRWVLPTFVDSRVKKSGEILAQLKKRYGPRLADPVRYSVKLSEATAYGQTIFEHDPRGARAQAYRLLVPRVAQAGRPSEEGEPSAPKPLTLVTVQSTGSQEEAAAPPRRRKTPRPRPVKAVPTPAPAAPETLAAAVAEPEPEAPPAPTAQPETLAAPAPEAPLPEGTQAEAATAVAALSVSRRQPLSERIRAWESEDPAPAPEPDPAPSSEGPASAIAKLWGRRLSRR